MLGARCSGAGCAAKKLQRRPGGATADRADDFRYLPRAEDRIDLGDLLLQLGAVALGEAAGDDQAAAGAVLLVLRHLEDGVDRLLLGRIDERAGIHHEDVGVGRVVRQLVARLLRQPEHHLGIDEVFGTPQRDQSDFHYGYNLYNIRG